VPIRLALAAASLAMAGCALQAQHANLHAAVGPQPMAVKRAPPAMLVEVPPPAPFGDAVWVGGYWVWQGNWIWAHGRWLGPPNPGYHGVHPYYEKRAPTPG